MEMKLGRLKQEERALGHLIGRSNAGTERGSEACVVGQLGQVCFVAAQALQASD